MLHLNNRAKEKKHQKPKHCWNRNIPEAIKTHPRHLLQPAKIGSVKGAMETGTRNRQVQIQLSQREKLNHLGNQRTSRLPSWGQRHFLTLLPLTFPLTLMSHPPCLQTWRVIQGAAKTNLSRESMVLAKLNLFRWETKIPHGIPTLLLPPHFSYRQQSTRCHAASEKGVHLTLNIRYKFNHYIFDAS